MNWGFKIGLAYTAFVLFMMLMVWKSCGEKIELVTDNYYEKELRFQGTIREQTNYRRLGKTVKLVQNASHLAFTLPAEEGTKISIEFLCPADSRRDRSYSLESGQEGLVSLEKDALGTGFYRATIRWRTNGLPCQAELPVAVK